MNVTMLVICLRALISNHVFGPQLHADVHTGEERKKVRSNPESRVTEYQEQNEER